MGQRRTKIKSRLARTGVGRRLLRSRGQAGRLLTGTAVTGSGPRLNLACGHLQLPGWINIDLDPTCDPDMVLALEDVAEHFESATVSAIALIHGLGYLSLAQARRFFRDSLSLLEPGACLIIETPNAALLSVGLASHDSEEYVAAVLALFATDVDGATHRHSYRFTWSEFQLERELRDAGYADVCFEAPLTHGQQSGRDLRCLAYAPGPAASDSVSNVAEIGHTGPL